MKKLPLIMALLILLAILFRPLYENIGKAKQPPPIPEAKPITKDWPACTTVQPCPKVYMPMD